MGQSKLYVVQCLKNLTPLPLRKIFTGNFTSHFYVKQLPRSSTFYVVCQFFSFYQLLTIQAPYLPLYEVCIPCIWDSTHTILLNRVDSKIDINSSPPITDYSFSSTSPQCCISCCQYRYFHEITALLNFRTSHLHYSCSLSMNR